MRSLSHCPNPPKRPTTIDFIGGGADRLYNYCCCCYDCFLSYAAFWTVRWDSVYLIFLDRALVVLFSLPCLISLLQLSSSPSPSCCCDIVYPSFINRSPSRSCCCDIVCLSFTNHPVAIYVFFVFSTYLSQFRFSFHTLTFLDLDLVRHGLW